MKKSNKSKITKSLFLLTAITLVFLASPQLGKAIDEETPTPDATSPAIQKIRNAVKEKVQNTIAQIQQGQKKGYVGSISELDTGSDSLTIILASKNKEAIIIQTDEETTILNDDREEVELADLEEGQSIIVMGYLAADGSLNAARVVAWEKPEAPVRETAFGEVEDISSDGEKILTVKNKKKQLSHTIEVTSTTKITKKVDGEVETVKFEEIEKGDHLVAVGKPMQNSKIVISAKIIHVIPGLSKDDAEAEETTTTPSPTETPADED